MFQKKFLVAVVAIVALLLVVYIQNSYATPWTSEQVSENAKAKYGKVPFSVEYSPPKRLVSVEAMGFDGHYWYSRGTNSPGKYDYQNGKNIIVYQGGEKTFRCTDTTAGPCVAENATPNTTQHSYQAAGLAFLNEYSDGKRVIEPQTEPRFIAGRLCDMITTKKTYWKLPEWTTGMIEAGMPVSQPLVETTEVEKQCIDRELGINLFLELYNNPEFSYEAIRVDTQNIAAIWDQSYRVNKAAFDAHYGKTK
jgi:hypothetical protein